MPLEAQIAVFRFTGKMEIEERPVAVARRPRRGAGAAEEGSHGDQRSPVPETAQMVRVMNGESRDIARKIEVEVRRLLPVQSRASVDADVWFETGSILGGVELTILTWAGGLVLESLAPVLKVKFQNIINGVFNDLFPVVGGHMEMTLDSAEIMAAPSPEPVQPQPAQAVAVAAEPASTRRQVMLPPYVLELLVANTLLLVLALTAAGIYLANE